MKHSATRAILADGPCQGQQLPITPGQEALEVTENFEYDQGRTRQFHGYGYEKAVINDPGVAVFSHRKSWQEPVVDQ